MGSHLGSQVNGSRAVSTTDDPDGGSFLHIEAQEHGPQQSHKHTDLGSSTQQQGLGVGNQRTKVGHGPYAHENQRREDFVFDPAQDQLHNAGIGFEPGPGYVGQNAPEGDRAQQQGFKAFDDGQVQQDAPYQHHHGIAPGKSHKPTVLDDRGQGYHKSIHVLKSSFMFGDDD